MLLQDALNCVTEGHSSVSDLKIPVYLRRTSFGMFLNIVIWCVTEEHTSVLLNDVLRLVT